MPDELELQHNCNWLRRQSSETLQPSQASACRRLWCAPSHDRRRRGRRRNWLQGHDNRVRLVIVGSAARPIDRHADQAADKDIACKAGGAPGGDFFGECDDLRFITFFAEGHRDIIVSLHLNNAWRHARCRNLGPGHSRFSAGRRRGDCYLFCPPPRCRRTPGTIQGQKAHDQNSTHIAPTLLIFIPSHNGPGMATRYQSQAASVDRHLSCNENRWCC